MRDKSYFDAFMAKTTKTKQEKQLPLEQTLWLAADRLRKNMDAAEYKHIVLGLIFLKYISDAFEEAFQKLQNTPGADPEDKDEYLAENIFFVPKEARWSHLLSRAKLPSIGVDIDNAMDEIEKENPSLKGVLTKEYAKPKLDKQALGSLIDLIGNIDIGAGVAGSTGRLGYCS